MVQRFGTLLALLAVVGVSAICLCAKTSGAGKKVEHGCCSQKTQTPREHQAPSKVCPHCDHLTLLKDGGGRLAVTPVEMQFIVAAAFEPWVVGIDGGGGCDWVSGRLFFPPSPVAQRRCALLL
jgi:hypothetical protein